MMGECRRQITKEYSGQRNIRAEKTQNAVRKKVGVRISRFKLSSADDKKTNKDTYVYINIFMINIIYILSYYIIYLVLTIINT